MTGAMLVFLYLAALAGLLGLELIRKAPPPLRASLLAAVGALTGLGGLAAFSLGGATMVAGAGAAIGAAAVVGGLLGARRMMR